MKRIAPRMLTEALVSSPAKSRVMPNARMMGHPVGAGSLTVPGVDLGASTRITGEAIIPPSLATDDVNNGEHNYPDRIHKMPIQGKDFGPLAMLRLYFSKKSENHADGENDQAHGDVKRMQPDKRVIRRAKKIRADGQTFFKNQALPLPTRSRQKNGAQCNRYKPPQSKRANLCISQSPDSEMNRQTAREQADGAKHRKLEHVLRHGARQTFADIENVSDHENREDRGLSGNQRKHSHSPARGENPIRLN